MVFCLAVYGIVYPCTAEIARRVVAQAQPIKPTYYGRSAILPQHQLVVGVSMLLRSRTGHICTAEVDNLNNAFLNFERIDRLLKQLLEYRNYFV